MNISPDTIVFAVVIIAVCVGVVIAAICVLRRWLRAMKCARSRNVNDVDKSVIQDL